MNDKIHNYGFFYIIVNFIIQKLKSEHTSLKEYTNWAKLIHFSLVLREREEKKNQIFRTIESLPLDIMKRENPWDISSIYDLAYFCCPECDYKHQDKQDFVSHASSDHPWVSFGHFWAFGGTFRHFGGLWGSLGHFWFVQNVITNTRASKILSVIYRSCLFKSSLG